MDELLLISVVALGGLLMFGLKFLRNFVEAKEATIQNEQLREATDLLSDLAFSAAEAVAKGAVDSLKAAAADGKLTRAEAAAAARRGKEIAFSQLSNEVQQLLIQQAGSYDGALERFVAPKLEAAVERVKDKRGRYERALGLPSEADVRQARDFLGL